MLERSAAFEQKNPWPEYLPILAEAQRAAVRAIDTYVYGKEEFV